VSVSRYRAGVDLPAPERGWAAPAVAPIRLVAPALAVLGGSAAALLGTLAVRVVLARTLAADQVGLLLLAIGVVSAIGGVASLGINPAAARRISQLRSHGAVNGARETARAAVLSALAAGALATAGVFASAPWLGALLARQSPEAFTALLRMLTPVILALPVGLATVGVCRGFGRVAGRALVRDGGGGALRAAGVGGAALVAGSLPAFGLGYSAAVLATELLFLAHGIRLGWFSAAASRGGHGPRLPGLPSFALLELLQQARQWLDLLVLGLLASPREVGYYGLARGLTRALEMVRSAPVHGFLPAAIAAGQGPGPEQLVEVYTRTRLVALALLWAPLMVCLLVPERVTGVLFGEVYRPVAGLLRLLALAVLGEALLGYKDQTLLALGHERTVVAVRAVTTGLTLGASCLLIPPLGARGAALALLASEWLRDGIFAVVLRRKTGLRLRAHDFPRPVRGALLLVGAAALVLALAPPGLALESSAAATAGLGGSLLLLRGAGGSLEGWRRFLAS